MRVLAIDPGPELTAFIVFDESPIEFGKIPNDEMLARLKQSDFGRIEMCGIEMVASYGMAVGKEVFETVFWIGRFYQAVYRKTTTVRVFRKDIKMHVCGTTKANDSNIRQALIDKYGAPGTKKNKGATYGISKDVWAALAIADYMQEFNKANQ